ncbi:ABC-2 type transport system permease protein [Natronoarchaeum philippinense]|uniref:ABC-2 type transport system permease protein n=2 Tax=Natronoarchaeum philippinense TaxID=558529 RepID=A0A285NBE8_NATPI|nr:ABC-2 type transport system permease protein [Natronoarchaeum philippinense]
MAQLLLMLLRIRVLLVVRYRMNFLAQIVSMYLFFAVIFFGGQAAAGSLNGGAGALGSTLDAVIVGWFLWTMAQSAYSSLSREITQESRWGTLEQLYISSYGFGVIIAGKMLVNMLMSLCIGGMMLALMLLTSGRSLALDLVTIVPLTTLALLSVVGLGFGFAGLTLVYKRISSISQLMQFALMGLVAAPRADVFVMNLLPLVKGSELLQRAMRSGVRLWEFPAAELGLLTGVAVVYSLGGYGVFRYCSNVARRRGVMGHY